MIIAIIIIIIIIIIINGGHWVCFDILVVKLKAILPGHTVAMVTYFIMKMITMCLPMIWQFIYTYAMIVATDKEWL